MSEGDGVSRNFRTAYYGKLGFCGNDEKNYLDLLIAASPSFNIEKLNDLCEKFELDRKSLDTWRVLLGVDCARRNPFDEYANVRRVRTEHFQSLKHHLEVLLKHNSFIKSRMLMKKNNKKTCLQVNELLSRGFGTSNNMFCNNYIKDDDAENNHSQMQSRLNITTQQTDELTDVMEKSEATNGQQQHDCLQKTEINTGSGKGETENSQIQNNHPSDQNGSSDEVNEVSKQVDKKLTAIKAGDETLLVDNLDSKPCKLITLMYLLEAGKLETSSIDEQLDSDYCRKLLAMANFFVHVSKDLQEAFFLFREVSKVVSS